MNEIKRLPTHPGDVLKEELESRGISQKYYSELIGVSYTMLNEILNGKRPVTLPYLRTCSRSKAAPTYFTLLV